MQEEGEQKLDIRLGTSKSILPDAAAPLVKVLRERERGRPREGGMHDDDNKMAIN